MDDRQIQNLVRMALEAEALESGRETAAPYRLADYRLRPRRALGWLAVAACAALATGAWVVLRPTPHPKELAAGKPALATHAATSAAPGHATAPGEHAASGEQCVVLTIYRDAYGDLSCVHWRPHEWSEGRNLSQLVPGELIAAGTDSWCDGPASEILVVAVAGPAESVPATDALAQDLAACIAYTGDSCEREPGVYSAAAIECLPPGVRAVAESVPFVTN